jgi:FlgD Ig-like domain
MRSLILAAAAVLITASLVFAEPNIFVRYSNGVPRVQLEGDYAHSTYSVFRATRSDGPYDAITNRDILCLGDCFAEDRTAVPGVTYFYRFDLLLGDGTLAHFGPYAVTFSPAQVRPVATRVYPNPMTGPATIEFFLGGTADQAGVQADASLFDAQGRRIRRVFHGTLPRGLTSLQWDGRDDAGRALRPGFYFLRFATPTGTAVTRVLRAQ